MLYRFYTYVYKTLYIGIYNITYISTSTRIYTYIIYTYKQICGAPYYLHHILLYILNILNQIIILVNSYI